MFVRSQYINGVSSTFIEDESLRDRGHIFKDRKDAGRQLARKLMKYRGSGGIVLAIPAGGVPVAAEIAAALDLTADLLIVRKLQIPDNPEAGFGAVGPEGDVRFNELLLSQLELSRDEVQVQVNRTLDVIKKRDMMFRRGRPYPDLKGRTVILVDDGLASGFTMLAAVEFVRRRQPGKIVVAVPTASDETVQRVLHRVDELVCLNVRSGFYFAVAEAYRHWYDLTDEEVMGIIQGRPFGTVGG